MSHLSERGRRLPPKTSFNYDSSELNSYDSTTQNFYDNRGEFDLIHNIILEEELKEHYRRQNKTIKE